MPQTSGFVIVFAPIKSNRMVFRNQNTIYHVCFGPPSRAKTVAFMMVWWDCKKNAKTCKNNEPGDYSITGVRNSAISGINKFSKLSSEFEFDKRTLKQSPRSRNDLDILFWKMGGDERCFMVGPGRLLWFASISPKPTGERALRKGVCVLKCNTCCPSVNFSAPIGIGLTFSLVKGYRLLWHWANHSESLYDLRQILPNWCPQLQTDLR